MFLLLCSIHTFQFILKQAFTNLYITDAGLSLKIPKVGLRSQATTFKIENSEENVKYKIIYADGVVKKVLDFDDHIKKLQFYPFSNGDSQKFEIIIVNFDDKTVLISHNDQCITYIEDDKYFSKEKCSEKNKEQVFQIIEVTPGTEFEESYKGEVHYHSSLEEKTSRMQHNDHSETCLTSDSLNHEDNLLPKKLANIFSPAIGDLILTAEGLNSSVKKAFTSHDNPSISILLKDKLLEKAEENMANRAVSPLFCK